MSRSYLRRMATDKHGCMMDSELLEILCCPETQQTLRAADPALLDELNRRIAAGTLKNRGGVKLEERIESGLVRADGKYLFPIQDAIPRMLMEEAIPIG